MALLSRFQTLTATSINSVNDSLSECDRLVGRNRPLPVGMVRGDLDATPPHLDEARTGRGVEPAKPRTRLTERTAAQKPVTHEVWGEVQPPASNGIVKINTLALPESLAATHSCPRHGGSSTFCESCSQLEEVFGVSGPLRGRRGPVSLDSEGAMGKALVMPLVNDVIAPNEAAHYENSSDVLEESVQPPVSHCVKSQSPTIGSVARGVVDLGCKGSVSDTSNAQYNKDRDLPLHRETCVLEGNTELLRCATSCVFDVSADSPRDCSVSTSNPFAVLEEVEEDCSLRDSLMGKAKTLVRWYKSFGLPKKGDPSGEIRCGQLRQSVRDCFSDVSPLWELSFKTIAKVEQSCCRACLPTFEKKLDTWRQARFEPQSVDMDHLGLFKERLRGNVQKGWDRYRQPFIPNGHATLNHKRREGGNWHEEEFSEFCDPCLVFSSGKPRIVTKYSSMNTSVLGELHYSLYTCLKKRGWLLVGDPTNQHVQHLNGSTLLSFDYSAATDNIKTAYVKAAIEVLKEQADLLTSDEIRCLDTLGSLKLVGDDREATRGQPMGSVMSFPLLCLINKTVVDLSLSRLLKGKEISFIEWSSHRCLVNGDDLLTREVRSDTNLRGLISEEGSKIGLVVNQEKTMSSTSLAEINSTLFSDGIKQRKFNAAAIWMDAGVQDVLGFAADASPDVRTFRRVVRANARILAKQSDKHLDMVPAMFRRICRVDKKIRNAITSLPVSFAPTEKGVISMSPLLDSENYGLSRDEENEAMRNEVRRVREKGIRFCSRPRTSFRTSFVSNAASYSSVLKKKRADGQVVLPTCYLRAFREKKWGALGGDQLATDPVIFEPVLDESKVNYLIGIMRSRKRETSSSIPRTINDAFSNNSDFVRLDCYAAIPALCGS